MRSGRMECRIGTRSPGVVGVADGRAAALRASSASHVRDAHIR
jgi:hypothetical protein